MASIEFFSETKPEFQKKNLEIFGEPIICYIFGSMSILDSLLKSILTGLIVAYGAVAYFSLITSFMMRRGSVARKVWRAAAWPWYLLRDLTKSKR